MMADMRDEGWAGSGTRHMGPLRGRKKAAFLVRKEQVDPQSPGRAGHFFFFAGFLAAGFAAAAGGSASGTLPTVTIWICRLIGEVGCAWSMNCSSPRPSDCTRLFEILKVFDSTSRMASARRWLRITLASRRPVESEWPTTR